MKRNSNYPSASSSASLVGFFLQMKESMEPSGVTRPLARPTCSGCARCAVKRLLFYCNSLPHQHSLWRMIDSDFKRSEASFSESASHSSSDAFSGEIFVRVVAELINSGGAFRSISIENTGKGYLTSDEWKSEMQKLSSDAEAAANTVVIDVCCSMLALPLHHRLNNIYTGAQPKRGCLRPLQRSHRSVYCKFQ